MKTQFALMEQVGAGRWMVVSEDDGILLLMQDIVARFGGIEVECFKSSEEAIDAFEARPEAYEFVITDLEMPEIVSFEFSCRQRPLGPVLKVMLSIGIELLSDEEAAQKGFCARPRKKLPFAALQNALSPAIIKHIEKFPGIPAGLRLACVL